VPTKLASGLHKSPKVYSVDNDLLESFWHDTLWVKSKVKIWLGPISLLRGFGAEKLKIETRASRHFAFLPPTSFPNFEQASKHGQKDQKTEAGAAGKRTSHTKTHFGHPEASYYHSCLEDQPLSAFQDHRRRA